MTPPNQTVVQNDYGYEIPFTLNDGNGNPVNLTGATMSLKVQNSQDTTKTDLTLTGAWTIDTPASGLCHYVPAAGDFPTVGTFLVQVTATFASQVITWTGMKLVVTPALPQSIA